MKEGDIVLVRLPQSDGNYKTRPALILKILPKYNDVLVCGISSQFVQEMKGLDEILDERNDYFLETGLRQTSLVRLLFIAVQSENQILGGIGKIPDTLHTELLQRLANFFLL
jgi:mRNA interferase MazF